MPNNKAVVIKGIAPMKQRPVQNSEFIDEVLFGMVVEVLEDAEEWLHVCTSCSYKGYLNKADVLYEYNANWEKAEKNFVIASFADILADSTYLARRIITLPRGTPVALTGITRDKWQEVMLPSGELGWIRVEALLNPCPKELSELRWSIVETALLYLGTQYRLGGKTPKGIDCSGLSYMSYLMNGIIIPRDTEEQMNFIKKIQRKESKPGDLLFFTEHVAVYIGEDKFVHAADENAVVKVNSLNKDSKLYRKDLDENYICTGTVF